MKIIQHVVVASCHLHKKQTPVHSFMRVCVCVCVCVSECFQESEHLKDSLKCCLLHLFGSIVAGGQVSSKRVQLKF